MKKNRRISLILLVIFVAVFLWYFLENKQDFEILLQINPLFLTLAGAGHLAVIVTNGLFVKAILAAFGKKIANTESFYVSLVSAIGNFFLPIGSGTGAQATYLKKKHNFSYRNFVTAISGNYIIVFLANSAIGITALYMLRFQAQGDEYLLLSLIFLVILLTTFYLAFIGLPKWILNKLISENPKSFINKTVNIFGDILKGWNIIVSNRKLMVSLIAITLFNFFSQVVITYSAVLALNLEIGVWPILLFGALGAISLLLNFTPGAIGIKEGLYVYASALLGFTIPQILSIALIDRGVKFFVMLLGWLLLSIKRVGAK